MNTGISQCSIKTTTHVFNKNMFSLKSNTSIPICKLCHAGHFQLTLCLPHLIIKLHTHPSFPSFSPAVLCPPNHPGESIIHWKPEHTKLPFTATFPTQVFTQNYVGQIALVLSSFFQVSHYSAVDFLLIRAQCIREFHHISASFPQ